MQKIKAWLVCKQVNNRKNLQTRFCARKSNHPKLFVKRIYWRWRIFLIHTFKLSEFLMYHYKKCLVPSTVLKFVVFWMGYSSGWRCVCLIDLLRQPQRLVLFLFLVSGEEQNKDVLQDVEDEAQRDWTTPSSSSFSRPGTNSVPDHAFCLSSSVPRVPPPPSARHLCPSRTTSGPGFRGGPRLLFSDSLTL